MLIIKNLQARCMDWYREYRILSITMPHSSMNMRKAEKKHNPNRFQR